MRILVSRITRVKLLNVLILACLMLGLTAPPAYAQEIVYGDRVPAGTVVDHDIILSGDQVSIDGTVHGVVLAFGQTISVDGSVDGLLLAIGQDIELNGSVGGPVVAIALQLVAGPEMKIGTSLYFAGLSLLLPPGATVGQDLLAATMGATLGGTIGRDVKAIVGPFEFARLLIGAAEEGDWLGSIQSWWESIRPKQVPSLAPSSSLEGRAPGMSRVAARTLAPAATVAAEVTEEEILQWLGARAALFIPLAFYGLVMLWLFPQAIVASAGRLRRKPVSTSLWGLLVFVVANQIYVVAAILSVLVVVIGLWLGFQSMWGFGLSILGLGLAGIGMGVTLLAIGLYAVSITIVCYALMGRAFRHSDEYLSRAGVMLLGLLVFVLLVTLPFVGPILVVLTMAVGAGAAFFAYLDHRREVREPESLPAPTATVAVPVPSSPSAASAASVSPPKKGRGSRSK